MMESAQSNQDAYKQVYNWQYVHSIDFWSIVLARTCDVQQGGSDLKPLVYPLVQVSLGAIKCVHISSAFYDSCGTRLVPNSRSHPFHLHVIRSLLHLIRHTETYIPLFPYILPVLTLPFSTSSRPKASTLRPLDLELHIRVPNQYLKTRVLTEGVVEESVYLLAEWLTSRPVHGSIAFPEVVIPVAAALRKAMKSSKHGGSGKDLNVVKMLLERVEEGARWVEQKRNGLQISPAKIAEVQDWERDLRNKISESPLAKYFKVQQKARERQKNMIEKVSSF